METRDTTGSCVIWWPVLHSYKELLSHYEFHYGLLNESLSLPYMSSPHSLSVLVPKKGPDGLSFRVHKGREVGG